MINSTQISVKLSELPIQKLALTHKFNIHRDVKITPSAYLLGFFMMLSNGQHTLSCWAGEVSCALGKAISKSGLSNKIQYPQVDFVKNLLEEALFHKVLPDDRDLHSELFSDFGRVFLEDSVCLRLPRVLHEVFPGSHSKMGATATARIQYRMNLQNGAANRVEVQSFRDHDAKFSADILAVLKPDDLVIRDLGYWSLKVFRQIMVDKKAFLLTRKRFGVNVYDEDTHHKIDLHERLKKADRRGIKVVKINVLVGREERVPLRLVAIRVPDNIANERRRKAKKDRNKRTNRSDEYMDMLDWTIFLTNVEDDVWTPEQMLEVYGFRWRIEIVFKAWKSKLNFQKIFKRKQSLTPPRAWITIYLVLLWIVLFFVPMFNYLLVRVYEQTEKFLSILKFAQFFKDHFEALTCDIISQRNVDFWVQTTAKHCTYDRRRKIQNFCEKLYMLNFTDR